MLKNPIPFQNKIKTEDAGIPQDNDHLRKMFIGGLSAITTEESLREFFSQWGEVIDVVVMRDPTTKRSRGFGFITYSDKSMVDKAQAARPHTIDGKTVDSKRALPRPELGKSEANSSVKKIFVGGLKENHDEQALSEHFSTFGNVVSVKILTDKTTGRKRGFAFVEFDDYDAVDKAVLHKNHTIKFVLVDVKKSVYKQELAKKFANQPGGVPQSGMVAPTGAGGVAGYAQQAATAFNPHAVTAYGYPTQMSPAVGAYNSWTGYAATPPTAGYQQPPPTVASTATGYGAYSAPTQNGAAAGTWNTATAYPTWGQNGYATPAAQITATTPAGAIQAPNGWSSGQNFGDYQQTYNGGPQKAGSLQTNRVNPYNVTSAPNYENSEQHPEAVFFETQMDFT